MSQSTRKFGEKISVKNEWRSSLVSCTRYASPIPARTKRPDNFIRPEFASRCQRHLFILPAQFRTMDMGVVSACFTSVLIKNRCPSRLTS